MPFSPVSEKPILRFKVRIGNEAERKGEGKMEETGYIVSIRCVVSKQVSNAHKRGVRRAVVRALEGMLFDVTEDDVEIRVDSPEGV